MTTAIEEQTIARILDSDAGRALTAQAAAARLAERREHVAAIKALREREATELPPLREAVKKTDARRFKLADDLKAANRVYDTARSAQYGAVASLAAAINVQEGKLVRSADPSIAAFVLELRALEEQMQRHGQDRVTVDTGLVDSFAKRIFRHTTNRVSVDNYLNAIRFEARPAARALALEALDADQITTRISEIRDALPIVTPPTDEVPDVAD